MSPRANPAAGGRKVGQSWRWYIYRYEERMRAVKLYIKFGKRSRATIREMGYPTKNAQIGWQCENERLQDLPIRRPKAETAAL